MKIKMDRLELLDVLKENKEKHIKIYTDAKKAWAEAMAKKCAEYQDELKDKPPEDIPDPSRFFGKFLTSIPQSHVNDYDRAIGMMGHHSEPVVDMEENEYRTFVQDQWRWSPTFNTTAASYSTNYLSDIHVDTTWD